ncbi:MAG TPA: STAS domain-containing protein [Chondromyces sp.]|nr:STAS domain-containing protein [Chondromyces sp.]
MEKMITELLENNYDAIKTYWKDELRDAIQEEIMFETFEKSMVDELFKIIFESLKKVDTKTSSELGVFYSRLVNHNASLNLITLGLQSFRRIALKVLIQEDLTREKILHIYNQIDQWFDPIIAQVVNDCSKTWESTFTQQKNALKELSAPVIQIFDHIAVLPLIGNIDEDRVKIIKENLLFGIAKHQVAIVFLDISGVPVVDTFVAQGLIDTARAAKLLGAECIIVGTRPEIAQTIVGLGIDLSEIRTFNSLHTGLLHTLNKLNSNVK